MIPFAQSTAFLTGSMSVLVAFEMALWPKEAAVDVEDRAGPGVIEGLRARGHEVTVSAPWSLGRVSAVARDGGMLYAAANARGMQGYAVGR